MTYGKNLNIILGLFFTLVGWSVYQFLTLELEWEGSREKKVSLGDKTNNEINRVFGMNYYVVDQNGPKLELNADTMIHDPAIGDYDLEKPHGVVYTSRNEAINYRALTGYYSLSQQELDLKEDVVLKGKNSEIKSRFANYFFKDDLFVAKENVKSKSFAPKTKDKIFIDAETLKYWPSREYSEYVTNVKGRLKRFRQFEGNVDFRSQQLNLNLKAHKIDLLEDVYLRKQTVTANSLRGEIFLENFNKKLKYYALYDDVKIEERLRSKEGDVVIRRAFAEKLEGLTKEKKILLTGHPRVIQGKNLIKGNRITLFENTEVVQVDDSTSDLILGTKQ